MSKKKIKLSSEKKDELCAIVKRFSEARILVLGDFILDQYIWGNVSRISPEAPVPVVDVIKETFVPGGALNVAHNIQTLGAEVYPCGVIGRDRRGRAFLKIVKRKGIDCGGIVVDKKRPTTLKTRVIGQNQQMVRFDRESKSEVSQQDRKMIISFCRKIMKDIDGVIIEDYGKGVVSPDLLEEVIAIAGKHDKFVAVDPKEKHFEYYKNSTIMTPNKKEAYGAVEASLDEPVEEVGRRLMKKTKCQSLLMTLGEDGMALFEKKKDVSYIPTAAREVFEVSGAGDTVIAVLSMAMAVGASLNDAAIISNLAAGIVVGKIGTVAVKEQELIESIIAL